MEMAILDLANFEPIGAGHGSRQKVHQAEAVPGSNHRNQGGWMVGDNAERRLEAARKHRRQRLVANRLVGKRIADRDHRVCGDLRQRDRLRLEDGMPVRRQEHERLTPEGAHHECPVGRLRTKRPDGDGCPSIRQSGFDRVNVPVQHSYFDKGIRRPELGDEAGQEFGAGTDKAGDRDPAGDRALRRAKVGDRVVNGGNDCAGPRQQPLPRVSQRQGPKPALDQGASKSVLETGDVSRNAWLREVDPVGGPGESSGIHDLQPRADPRQLKIQSRPFGEQISPAARAILSWPRPHSQSWS